MGANARGKLSDADLLDIENHACPGAGACGGQFTANTMATVMELIGLSPMGTAAVPQVDKRKDDVAFGCGAVIMNAVRNNILPRDICTRTAFDNAIAGVAGTAGSTNAVLHLLAMAREAELPLTIDDFEPSWRAHPSSWTSSPAANTWPPTSIRPAESEWSHSACSKATT